MAVKIKNILAVIILVATFILGAVLGWIIKPDAKPQPVAEAAKVTVNPSTKETKKADVAVKVQSSGVLSGTASLPKRTGSDREVVVHPERPAGPGGESVGLTEGDSITVPVSGTITAKFTDAKTGKQIREGSRPVSGETTVQVDGDQITVDTKFDDNVTFALEMPEPKKRLWHVGGMASWSHEKNQVVYDIYIQRDWVLFRTKKADWVIWARGELELSGDGRRVMVGVERRW